MTDLALSKPRLPFWLSCLIFVLLWQVASSLGGLLPMLGWAVLHRDELLAALKDPAGPEALRAMMAQNGDLVMVASAASALPTFGVVVLCRKFIDGQAMATLGLRFEPRRFGVGFAAGAVAVLTVTAVLFALGVARSGGLASPVPVARIGGLLPAVLLQSGTEELVCRGYLLRTVMGRLRPATSIALVSLFFGALHLLNPAASVLGFTSTVMIGVLFSLVTLRTGTLWAAIGLHTAWNFTLGTIASLPVSGMRLSHVFLVDVEGPSWLTGGGYGLEASVLTVAAAVAGCALVATRRSSLTAETEWSAR